MARPMRDSHRRFLQTMMSQSVLDKPQVLKLQQHCIEVHPDRQPPEQLEEFLGTINAQLEPMMMQIRWGMSEEDGKQYYCLVNMADTEITRLAADYSDSELEVFKKTVELVVESGQGTALSTDILNSVDALQARRLKKKESEQVLQQLVTDGWLNERAGEYSLSTRCVMEMEPYLRSMFPEQLNDCLICHSLALQSQPCVQESCDARIHKPCAKRYFRGREKPCCPTCSHPWSHDLPDTRRSQSRS